MSEIKCSYCNNEPHFVPKILTYDGLVKDPPYIKNHFLASSCELCGIKTYVVLNDLDKLHEMNLELGARRKKMLQEKGLPLL